MQIEITVANEALLVEDFRDELRRLARMAVIDSPERVGKRYAYVTLPYIMFKTLVDDTASFSINWV